MTVVTKYDVATKSTVVLLKYRSFNDLPTKLKCDLISKLKELVCQRNTALIAHNPFAVSLLHFNCTAQWYRRAARDPRDSVRHEEEKAHDISKKKKNEVEAINVRRLHLTMRNLDQDKLQLTQIIGTISSLRKQHESFYRFVKKATTCRWVFLPAAASGRIWRNGLLHFFPGSAPCEEKFFWNWRIIRRPSSESIFYCPNTQEAKVIR